MFPGKKKKRKKEITNPHERITATQRPEEGDGEKNHPKGRKYSGGHSSIIEEQI